MKNGWGILCVIAGGIFSLPVGGQHGNGQSNSTFTFAADSIAEKSKTINAPGSQRAVRFSGAVLKGQSFERRIGANLFFRLIPLELGWTISVGSGSGPGNNFCGVVTPPYRGVNQIYVEGWHFRNADNSGPNEPGPKNVNAPQEVRDFNFVLNDADNRKAFDALQILLWPYSYSKQQIHEADDTHAKLPKGNGTLTIRDLQLNRLEPGKQAGIERMTFDVELLFPR
jgi:hypothetical protein